MKAGAMTCLVLGLLLLPLVSGIAYGRDCTTSPGVGSSISQQTLSLPTGLEVLTGGAIDLNVKIVLQEGHSLNLSQDCDCTPPCAVGTSQHTSVKVIGESSAFGGTVEWEEQSSDCISGTGGSQTEVGSVSIAGSYTEGTGRWFEGANASLIGMSGDKEKAMMAFRFHTTCGCREEECSDQDTHYPEATAIPEELHLIVGDTVSIRIDASDDDNDLQVSSIRPIAPAALYVAPTSGGGPGGATASATFSITCHDEDISESAIRFTVWDDLGQMSEVKVPVNIWRGRPMIEILEEKTGWETGAYVVRFRIDDPDFADYDLREEIVTWGVSDIRGGEVLTYEDVISRVYCAVFVPSEAPGTQRFTIWAEDIVGHSTTLQIIVNADPVAKDDSFNNIKGPQNTAIIEGNVLTNDSDPDGDDLTAALVPGSGPLVGALVEFNADGSFIYAIDTGEAETPSFEYTVSDGRGGTDTATVTLEVYAPSGSPPTISASLAGTCVCPSDQTSCSNCYRYRISVDDPDFEIAWSHETVVVTAIFVGQSVGGSPVGDLSFDGESTATIEAGGITDVTLTVRLNSGHHSATIDVTVTDEQGHSDTTSIHLQGNAQPKVQIEGKWVTRGSTSFNGMLLSKGPYVITMDPAWYEAGCLQFRDLDGDTLTFRVSQMPELGTVNLMIAGSNGNYFVTVMYEVDREEMLTCHRDRRPLIDRLVIQATDPYSKGSSNA